MTHASIWKFEGDPADLLPRYDAMLAEIPSANMRLHLCLRAEDGIVIVDTCPSREAFLEFTESETFRAMLARHGLPFLVASTTSRSTSRSSRGGRPWALEPPKSAQRRIRRRQRRPGTAATRGILPPGRVTSRSQGVRVG